jgi:bacillopeptidase F (M6 metalloprotease family)
MTKRLLMCFLFLPLLLTLSSNSSAEEVVYQYGFELGQNGWEIDNGIWELCVYGATTPPDGGFLYFSTVCDANYPTVPDSRLISPEIQLPAPGTLAPDEELHLRFWHWFSYSGGDYGYVQISVYDESTGWSAWETLGSGFGWAESNVWSPALVDLTEYAGKKVRIAFFHTTNNDSSASYGWYVDNVKVIKVIPEWEGDFENGWGDWSAGNGVWKVGAPVGGTSACYSGTQCAGTILGSTTYPRYTDSRLVSPSFRLDTVLGKEELHLRFWHWFSYSGGDYGYVQISVYDESTGWSAWETLGSGFGWAESNVWSPASVDLTEYAGKKVRIAFSHTTNDDSSASYGWYVDSIEVIKGVPAWDGDFECDWGDWSAGNGVWKVGTPVGGTKVCYSGTQCAGTILGSTTYPRYTDSRLVSPTFEVPAAGAAELSFRHWYSYSAGDYGKVQISVYDALAGWSSWQDLTAVNITGVSAGWTKHPTISLAPYAGQKVRIAFFHVTNDDSSASFGWYVDYIRITGFPHFCDCDLFQDGKCNILDYQRFIQDWGRTNCGTPPGTGTPPNDCECDLNKDGKCNILDYQRFIEDWGNTSCQLCP